MVSEAESHADEARTLKELADTKNIGETLAYQTEKALADHRDKLDSADAGTIEGRIMELRSALETNDVAEIRSKTQALEQAAQPLAQALYAQANEQAASSAPAGDGGSGDTDEVVEDADYEVIDEDEAAKTT
jgi:molecular chaperone DnaK